jgi:hypothetical protein
LIIDTTVLKAIMPLPNDEELIATVKQVLEMFRGAFGSHPGYRLGKKLKIRRCGKY